MVPVTATVVINLNGTPIPGATASRSFTTVNSPATLNIFTSVNVPSGTAVLTATPTAANFDYTDATMTVWKLGPAA